MQGFLSFLSFLLWVRVCGPVRSRFSLSAWNAGNSSRTLGLFITQPKGVK